MSFADDLHDPPAKARDPLDGFHEFAGAVRTRLDKGRAEHGDASFSAEPDALLEELQGARTRGVGVRGVDEA